jgi:hypothetical protein
MASRLRRGDASGPAEWLLVFLQARDHPPRARAGSAAGPTEWLLVFLGAATADAAGTAVEAAVGTAVGTTVGAVAGAVPRGAGRSRWRSGPEEHDLAVADDAVAGFGGETT